MIKERDTTVLCILSLVINIICFALYPSDHIKQLLLFLYVLIQGNGFAAWGPKFTAAGECARISLEFALAAVVTSSVLIVIVPTHGIVFFPCTGEIILLNQLGCTRKSRTEFDIRIFLKRSQTAKPHC